MDHWKLEGFGIRGVSAPDFWIGILKKTVEYIKKLDSNHGQIHITVIKPQPFLRNQQLALILLIALLNIKSRELPTIHIKCSDAIGNLIQLNVFLAVFYSIGIQIIADYEEVGILDGCLDS